MSAPQAIGVDLIEIDRVKQIHKRHGQRFFDRMLTRAEQSYCLTKGDPYPSVAARIAAKEAVAKALGVGIGGVLKWTSVSVDITALGAPVVILDESGKKALRKLGAKEVLISLSHSRELAIATAVLK